jgi:hypothetical protein
MNLHEATRRVEIFPIWALLGGVNLVVPEGFEAPPTWN